MEVWRWSTAFESQTSTHPTTHHPTKSTQNQPRTLQKKYPARPSAEQNSPHPQGGSSSPAHPPQNPTHPGGELTQVLSEAVTGWGRIQTKYCTYQKKKEKKEGKKMGLTGCDHVVSAFGLHHTCTWTKKRRPVRPWMDFWSLLNWSQAPPHSRVALRRISDPQSRQGHGCEEKKFEAQETRLCAVLSSLPT